MSATHSTRWFWSDWLGDQAVRRLTLAERGLWIDLLALAAGGSPTGYVCDDKGRPLTLEEIARVTNAASPDEVAELIVGIVEKGAASRDRAGRLFNRRMVRDGELAAKRRAAGSLGGEATRSRWKEREEDLPGQLPQQMPGQNGKGQGSPSPPIPPEVSEAGSARARDGSRTSADAFALAEEIAVLCGIVDLAAWPPGWCGAPMRVQAWLNHGWSREIAMVGVHQAIAKNCTPWPPKSIQFFEGWITTAIARQASPLPAPRLAEQRSLPLLGVVPEKDGNHGERSTSRVAKRGLVSGCFDRLAELAQQGGVQAAESGEGGSGDGGDRDPVRQLHPRQRGVR